MALKEARVTIGERSFVIRSQPTDIGRKLYFKLTKIAGPALVELLKVAGNAGLAKLDVALIAPAAYELIQNLSEDDFDYFYESFLASTDLYVADVKTGKSNTIPLATMREWAFTADYGALTRWMFEHLKLNFSSFLGAWGITSPLVSQAAGQQ